MSVSSGLKRLLRVRSLQEEQRRLALESARDECDRLQKLLAALRERAANGRVIVKQGIGSADSADRIVGLAEQDLALRVGAHLGQAIEAAELRLLAVRAHYLSARTEKRQAEVLIANRQQEEARENARKEQRVLDENTIAGFARNHSSSPSGQNS